MKTKSLKSDEIRKDWYVANAEGKTLGRFASEIAKVLRGKHKPSFTPHMDMGDFVVVIHGILHGHVSFAWAVAQNNSLHNVQTSH